MKIKPFFQDVILTFITQGLVLLSFFSMYWLIARSYGVEGVGQYSLVKKIYGLWQPLLLLGFSIGLPRYIAQSGDRKKSMDYLKTGGVAVIVVSFLFLFLINVFSQSFARIFFGSTNYSNFVFPFSFFFAGSILYSLAYSYFQGRLLIKLLNILTILTMALVPLAVIILWKGSPMEYIIDLIGIATFGITLFFLSFYIKELISPIKKESAKKLFKELFGYSFPRFIATLIYAALLSLCPIIAAHVATMKEVGYLSISQSLLTALGVAVAPLSLVMFPKVSNMVANKREKEVEENVNYLIGAIIQCAIFICFQLIIFSDIIIKYWLGPEFVDAVLIMRITFSSIIFYLFFVTIGNILEAIKVKPINLINLCISFGVFLIVSVVLLFLVKLFSPVIGLSVAFSSGLICLGILTYVSIRKIYPDKLSKDLNYLLVAIGINTLLGGVTLLIKLFISSKLFYLIIFEILISLIYLSILWCLKINWLKQIPKLIFR